MLNYLDILDRANNGPYLSEENWDLEKVAMTARRLVKKYKLDWDKNDLITDDASLSEAIFKADTRWPWNWARTAVPPNAS